MPTGRGRAGAQPGGEVAGTDSRARSGVAAVDRRRQKADFDSGMERSPDRVLAFQLCRPRPRYLSASPSKKGGGWREHPSWRARDGSGIVRHAMS